MARNLIVLAALPAFALSCGGGPAGSTEGTSTSIGREDPGPGRDPAVGDRDPAAGGREAAGDGQDPSSGTGSSGAFGDAGPTGDGSAAPVCIACDVTYTCNGTEDGAPVTNATVTLATTNHVCTATSPGQTPLTIQCDGTILAGQANVGSWKQNGNNVSVTGAIATLSCAPGK